jgi:hypothetical protein
MGTAPILAEGLKIETDEGRDVNRQVMRVGIAILVLSGILNMASCREANEGVVNKTVSSEVKPVAVPTGAPNYGGAVDTITCDAISGWVWNSSNFYDDIKVDIYADRKLIGTVPAVIPRLDLRPMGGTGNYAFQLPVPVSLKDGQSHTVSAKVSGSNVDVQVWDQIKPTFVCGK